MAILQNLRDEDVEWKAPWMNKFTVGAATTPEYHGWQTQNETLKRGLSENQKEKGELENRVAELEESLHRYRNRNSVMELKASLNRIEEMKERIEELEAAL
ncbi:hypothetical protein Gotur_028652 [Gossypium turneri]